MRRRRRRPHRAAGDGGVGAGLPLGADSSEVVSLEHPAAGAHGGDDGVADRPGEEPVAEGDEAGQRRGEAGKTDERARADRGVAGEEHRAVRVPAPQQVDARNGESFVDGSPREAVRRQFDRRGGQAIERQPSPLRQRDVPGRCGRGTDRARPGVAPLAVADDVAEPARRAADRQQ